MAYGLVNDSGAREQYTASIGETNFAYPFEIFADGDLIVWLTPNGQEPDPVLDLLVLNTNYTVTGAGAEGGGDVVLVVAATGGDVITIERDLPIERLVDYSVGGDFSGLSINQQLDKLTMTQQQNESVNETRQLTYLPTDQLTTGDTNLPKLETDQIWAKSAAGGIIAATIEESTGWSTLRSELANELSGTDGARIVGYYDSVRGSETVKDKLDAATDLPVPDTTSIVHDPVTPSKQMRIDVGAVSAATVRVLTIPDKDIDLTPASIAEVEAETVDNKFIAPANAKYQKGIAKAWATFDGNGVVTIKHSHNITSIVRNGTGVYTITWSVAFTDANWLFLMSAEAPLVGAADDRGYWYPTSTKSANSVQIELVDHGDVARDSNLISVMAFGLLA